ncbi:hypothetical protein BEUL_2046 [Bifidobacterium eulemuris]|uniref:Uncharacterized protein n=2 Tax=Bifidobacterium eulemuris TaxID=1765219 RepID=A0A261G235_9BIFI|nr:hypothetical protein BEUL_2046 [Bifidobacterium eulemuris]QOL33259.1 hypothetical protein BE0216_10715 [Bifidobacterium eulemuris]
MSKSYQELKTSPAINLVWLVLIVASASIGILAGVIYILAVTNVQILSWSIGYVLTSGTNAAIMTPCLVAFCVSAVVFVLCMLKNVILKALTK